MAWQRPYEKLLIVAGLSLLLLLIYLLQPILTPFLVGMAIAYLGDPMVDRLQRYVGRTAGVIIVFVFLVLIFSAGLLLMLPVLLAELAVLGQKLPAFLHWLQQYLSPLLLTYFNVDPLDFNLAALKYQLAQHWQQVGDFIQILLIEVTASGFALLGLLANLVLIPVVSFYLMRDWDLLVGHIRAILPRDVEPIANDLACECDEVLSAFLRGQMLVMLILGIIYAAGLILVGLDSALLIGIVAGLASIVPYLGFIIGIGVASLAALVQFQELLPLIYVWIVFAIGQFFEGVALTPLLVGDKIGLHPVAVIFAILAGGQLFGFTGILLALPVAAVIMVFLRHLHAKYVNSHYYGAKSVGNDVEFD